MESSLCSYRFTIVVLTLSIQQRLNLRFALDNSKSLLQKSAEESISEFPKRCGRTVAIAGLVSEEIRSKST